jgi:hypothetical protein
MSPTLSPSQSEFAAGPWADEPLVDDPAEFDATHRPAGPKNGRFPSKQPSFGKRGSRSPPSEFSAGRWATEPPVDDPVDVDATYRPADPKNDRIPGKQSSLVKRGSRALGRFMITFCIGVAATLAWQSYGDAARERIAKSSPQLGWLAPQVAPFAQTAREMIAPAPTAAPSSDLQQLRAMSLGLDVMRKSVDQLAAQFVAGQEQMARDINKLQAAEQDILDKISSPPPRPAAVPARKPVPMTPPMPSQAPPAH